MKRNQASEEKITPIWRWNDKCPLFFFGSHVMVRVFSIGTVGMWGRQRQGGTCAEKKNFGKNKMGGQTIRLSGTLEGAPPI